jgi:hypothetical protein
MVGTSRIIKCAAAIRLFAKSKYSGCALVGSADRLLNDPDEGERRGPNFRSQPTVERSFAKRQSNAKTAVLKVRRRHH